MSDVVAKIVKVKSHDGVLVPMVILHKKDLKLDGKNPLIMSGYGAFGINQVEPIFSPNLLLSMKEAEYMHIPG